MTKYLRFISILLFCAVTCIAQAGVWTIENLPSPKSYGQNYYVANPDSVLSADTEKYLNELLTNLYQTTEAEVAVVAFDQYDENRYYARGFAIKLFNKWGIGSANKNTGVMVFLARHSREVEIITGAGIEGILTDAKCGEILDNNLDKLAENDFDLGISGICKDIYDYLEEDANRAELLLDYRPKTPETFSWTSLYFYLSFLILILLSIKAYRSMKPVPGKLKEDLEKEYDNAQTAMGCMTFLFPVSLLPLYLFIRHARKNLHAIPLNCPQCGHSMDLIRQVPLEKLTKTQQKEVELEACQYILWHCPECGEEEKVQREGKVFAKYDPCPICQGRTMLTTNHDVQKRPTYYATGLQINTLVCQCCGHRMTKRIVLPKKEVPRESSYGGSSGSSGSSSSSSGSWGGGRTSGGGAGRRF